MFLSYKKAFTLVELLVTVSIFAFMTAFVAVKYGSMSQSILLTNTAYDIALAVRQAQAYGINVRSSSTGSNSFEYAYGVSFNKDADPTKIILFADTNSNLIYGGLDTIVSIYNLKRGNKISGICVGTGPSNCNSSEDRVDITFKRPDPSARIQSGGSGHFYTKITLESPEGQTRSIVIRKTGQISVED